MKKFAMIAICAAVLLSVASCNTNNDSQGTSTDRVTTTSVATKKEDPADPTSKEEATSNEEPTSKEEATSKEEPTSKEEATSAAEATTKA